MDVRKRNTLFSKKIFDIINIVTDERVPHIWFLGLRKVENVKNNIVRILFAVRVALWIIAAAAAFYWIYWSFKLYDLGFYDVHEYSSRLRPILGRGLLISLVSICISFILRAVSDKIKKRKEHYNDLQ